MIEYVVMQGASSSERPARRPGPVTAAIATRALARWAARTHNSPEPARSVSEHRRIGMCTPYSWMQVLPFHSVERGPPGKPAKPESAQHRPKPRLNRRRLCHAVSRFQFDVTHSASVMLASIEHLDVQDVPYEEQVARGN